MNIAEMMFDYYSSKHPIQAFTKKPETKDVAVDLFSALYNDTEPKTDIAMKAIQSPVFETWKASCQSNVLASLHTALRVMAVYYSSVNNKEGNANKNEADFLNKIESKEFKDMMNDQLQVVSAIGQFGGQGEDTVTPTSIKDLSSLLDKCLMNPRIMKFIDMFGDLRKSLSKSISDNKFADATNISDVELGRDLRKLMASERMGLVTPELELLNMYKFATSRLMQYKYERTTDAGGGPIMILLDTSSSMAYANEGPIPMDTACAATMAMIVQLKKQNREFRLGLFDDRLHYFSNTNNIDQHSRSLSAMISFVSSIQPNGGTSFHNLFNSNQVLNTMDEGFDVCMITDGYGDVTQNSAPRFFELLKKRKLHTFKIIHPKDQNAAHACALDAISSSVMVGWDVEDFKQFTQKVIL